MPDQPTAPAPDYPKMPRPPKGRKVVPVPQMSPERQRERAEHLRRFAETQPDVPPEGQDKDLGMTDEEVNRMIREMG